jgi:hypothetical protein
VQECQQETVAIGSFVEGNIEAESVVMLKPEQYLSKCNFKTLATTSIIG